MPSQLPGSAKIDWIKVIFLWTLGLYVSGCASFSQRNSELMPRVLDSGIIAPDGGSVFVTAEAAGIPQVWKVNEPLGVMTQLTFGTEANHVVAITLDGRFVVIRRQGKSESEAGLFLLPREGGALVEVQDVNGVRASYVSCSSDGEMIVYLANDLKSDSFALYSYEFESGKRELLFSEPGDWSVTDTFGGIFFLMGRSKGEGEKEYFVWNLGTGALQPLVGQKTKGIYNVGFAQNNGEYLVLTTADTTRRQLQLLRGGSLRPIEAVADLDVSSFVTDLRHSKIYVSWRENNRLRLEILHGGNFAKQSLKGLPEGGSIFVGQPSRFGRYVGLRVEHTSARQSIYMIDWGTAKATEWIRQSF